VDEVAEDDPAEVSVAIKNTQDENVEENPDVTGESPRARKQGPRSRISDRIPDEDAEKEENTGEPTAATKKTKKSAGKEMQMESGELTPQNSSIMNMSGSNWKAKGRDAEVDYAAEQIADSKVAASAAERQDRLRERRRRRRRDRQV
jgi:hypothetical protein